MATDYDGLFMRDSLSDTGAGPSPGFPYYSPDVISHEQVSNPQQYFVQNYDSNPNQPVQLGNQANFIYTRAKNLSSRTLTGWSISIFRSNSSLFLNTDLWSRNPLLTASGASYTTLNSTPPQGIAVGNDVLLLNAPASNQFCLIGIASPVQPPVIPRPFESYTDYLMWVRTNRNVCGNNLTVARDYPNRQYTRLDSLSNPGSEPVPVLFLITVKESLPAGSTFGVTCATLKLNSRWNISDGPQQMASAMLPPNFSGYVETWGSLPEGQHTWPDGAMIQNKTYIGLDPGNRAAVFAEPWRTLGTSAAAVPGLHRNGVLVLLGSIGTYFSTRPGALAL